MCCMKLLEISVHNCAVGLSHVWCVRNLFLRSSTEGQQICHMSKAMRHPLHSALNAPLLLTGVGSRLFLGLNVFIRMQWHHSWKCCSHTINSATNSCDFRQAQTDTTVSYHYVMRPFLSISNFFLLLYYNVVHVFYRFLFYLLNATSVTLFKILQFQCDQLPHNFWSMFMRESTVMPLQSHPHLF